MYIGSIMLICMFSLMVYFMRCSQLCIMHFILYLVVWKDYYDCCWCFTLSVRSKKYPCHSLYRVLITWILCILARMNIMVGCCSEAEHNPWENACICFFCAKIVSTWCSINLKSKGLRVFESDQKSWHYARINL